MVSKKFYNRVLRRARQLGFDEWVLDWDEDAVREGWADEYLPEWLTEQGVDLAEDVDALLFDRLDDDSEPVLEGFPVLLLHHTSSKAAKRIRREGLLPASTVGGPTDKGRLRGESPHYVFLTTEVTGPVVRGYQARAVRRFGGRWEMLYIRVPSLREVQADEDDADISSGARQFMTDYVPSSWIL